ITTHVLKTLAPEKLTSTGYMLFTFETNAGSIVTTILCKRRSRDTQLWIFGKLSNQKLKIIRFERKVGIQITNYFKRNRLHVLESCVKRVNLAGEATIKAWPALHQLDPRKSPGITLNDFSRAIRGTVINNDPLFR